MIDPTSTRMFAEAAEAAAVVAAQRYASAGAVREIAARLRARPPAAVITYGRGSSDHAATYAKYLIETRLGIPTASAAPSVASVYGASARAKNMLCLAFSQSGRSPDLVAALETARAGGATTVALVNAVDSPLADAAEYRLPLGAGDETSVAATKSFIASLSMTASLVSVWAGDEALGQALDEVPVRLATAWQADWSPLGERLKSVRGLYVVGRGLGLGIAQEAALKLKETCGLHAEALSAAELRHGPLALVGPDFPLLVFRQSDETGDSVDALIRDADGLGADILVAGPAAAGGHSLPVTTGHPAIEPMLQITSFYREAVRLSTARGFDPDRPPHLSKVTETL
ncbi:SIS domain-containing protein [Sphingosinicella terrae]|uniref:SIS domain-containing protein n=1 Tax=Sphingosinicella terrae TaxID=2172047 RepID=UPI000E0DC99C|nr:SIS domain-containing protein [Sphingosinicella terrae]